MVVSNEMKFGTIECVSARFLVLLLCFVRLERSWNTPPKEILGCPMPSFTVILTCGTLGATVRYMNKLCIPSSNAESKTTSLIYKYEIHSGGKITLLQTPLRQGPLS
jgi:hypothetical protein